MSKKPSKKVTKKLAPETERNQTDGGYLAEPQELNAQRQRLKKPAAVALEALKSFAPAARPRKLPTLGEPAKSPREATTVAEAPTPPTPPKVRVTFAVVDLGAKQVSVSGEFNGWSPDATPMKRRKGGHWETAIDLAPGRYEYKFVVDGNWIPDPMAQEQVWNYHGTLNSVVEVRS